MQDFFKNIECKKFYNDICVEDFSEWFRFTRKEQLEECLTSLGCDLLLHKPMLEKTKFPQWVGITLKEGNTYGSYYSFTTLDSVRREIDRLEAALDCSLLVETVPF